jgi:FkbM family methyltransferase
MKSLNYVIRNISFGDIVLNYLSYLKCLNKFTKMRSFLRYRRIYRNYINVSMNILRKKYPIEAVMRNGTPIVLRNNLEAQLHGGRHEGFQYDINNDTVTLSTLTFENNRIVTIHGGITNGDISGIFVDNVYRCLPVKNKTVVDIGGNIADSAVYFALCGATKIICLEPFPKNYEIAKENIQVNNFSNIITIILAGCSAKREEITIDPDYKSGVDSILNDFKFGIKVPLLTLEDILKESNFEPNGSFVLKMDCEGCEYKIILSANEKTLQKFSYVMIEYHYGYKNLKEKLEECGFVVSVTRPEIYSWSPDKLHQKNYYAVGYILAKRD